MTDIVITFDENDIAQEAIGKIADNLVNSYRTESKELKRGIRDGVEKAVKELIYANKDEIIEICIARASDELTRKGITKLLDKLNQPAADEAAD